jgi:hypothetical protein
MLCKHCKQPIHRETGFAADYRHDDGYWSCTALASLPLAELDFSDVPDMVFSIKEELDEFADIGRYGVWV